MIETNVDTSNLQQAINEFSTLGKKDMVDVVKQQGGILTGHLIAMTPPARRDLSFMSDQGGITLQSKKAGEARVASDISLLFPTTKLSTEKAEALVNNGYEFYVGKAKKKVNKFTESLGELRQAHKAARSPATGRVRTYRGSTMVLTRSDIRKQLIDEKKKKVGMLAAGFLAAARILSTAKRMTPGWIARHGEQSGGADISTPKDRVAVRIFNSQTWFPHDMSKRLQVAVNRRETGLRKAMQAMMDRKAKKAQQKLK